MFMLINFRILFIVMIYLVDVLSFSGDNVDKFLDKFQQNRNNSVAIPFNGNVSEYIPSNEAAAMTSKQGIGKTS